MLHHMGPLNFRLKDLCKAESHKIKAALAVWGCSVCFLAACIHAADVRLSFRRSGGGRVPSGGEGHGAAGGSGVRRGSDHPLCCHLLLPHPGHSLKRDPGRDEGRMRGRNGTVRARDLRPAHRGVCGRRGGIKKLWKPEAGCERRSPLC